MTIHEHCAEAGAIGAALEALRLYRSGHATRFPGLAHIRRLQFETTTGETTRCSYCANHCLRTFIDFGTGERRERMIVASCEKGASQTSGNCAKRSTGCAECKMPIRTWSRLRREP